MIKITFQDHIGETNVFWSKEAETLIRKLLNFNDKSEVYCLTPLELKELLRDAVNYGGDGSNWSFKDAADNYIKELGLEE